MLLLFAWLNYQDLECAVLRLSMAFKIYSFVVGKNWNEKGFGFESFAEASVSSVSFV